MHHPGTGQANGALSMPAEEVLVLADDRSEVNREDVLDELFATYSDLMDAFGPNSSEAAQFLEELKWHAEFSKRALPEGSG